MTTTRVQLTFDVTEAVRLDEPCSISATLFLPAALAQSRTRAILLVPGSTHTRRYYDLHVAGHEGYSAAEQLAAHGIIVLAIDNLATGASTRPHDGGRVRVRAMAAAISNVAAQFRAGLAAGTLDTRLPAGDVFLIGVGHSLGGCLMTLQQAASASCDAVAILGWTCQYIKHAVDPAGVPQWTRQSTSLGYGASDVTARRSFYHSYNVPDAVIAADEAVGRTPMPDGMEEVLQPGFSATAAALISVPILLAFGSVDVSPEPFAEPGFYLSSHDITLLHLPDTAHCHTMSVHRIALWDRIVGWSNSLASAGRSSA